MGYFSWSFAPFAKCHDKLIASAAHHDDRPMSVAIGGLFGIFELCNLGSGEEDFSYSLKQLGKRSSVVYLILCDTHFLENAVGISSSL